MRFAAPDFNHAKEAASETAKVVQEPTSLRVDLSVLKTTKDEAVKQAEHRFTSLQRDSDARIARLASDLEAARSELTRCGSENAGLRERLEILGKQRKADLAQHREEVGKLRGENSALQSKMDELRITAEKRVLDAQGRVEAALRDQATLAESNRRELAAMLEKSRGQMSVSR